MPAPLPTPWNLYNLTASPFFQDYLNASSRSPAPLSLFVGREAEIAALRGRIHGAGTYGTRQAVAGDPGIGKTTLVQEVKALLQEDGYFTTDSFVAVLPDDTTERLFGRVLSVLYDTIVANRPGTVDNPTIRDAQVLVRAARLSSPSGGISLAGFGFAGGSTAVPTSPADIMIDGPRVMRDLMHLVADSDGRGAVVHINNFETLSEREAKNGAEIFRALRDPMAMHDHLHLLLVGTTDAVNTVVNTHPQVRSVVSTVPLLPLSVADVHRLLEARYEHLRRDREWPVIPPVSTEGVDRLYGLYRGDLRGLLKALDDGVTPLLGIAGTESDSPRPLTIAEIGPVLRARYRAELQSLPEQPRVEQLTQWGESSLRGPQTQKALQKLWKVKSQGTVSQAVNYLVRQGYVVALPREGVKPIEYLLSGTSALIFGLDTIG